MSELDQLRITIAQQAAEIERLNELCKEYRENGDRLMRVADEYKAEIERLKADSEFDHSEYKRLRNELKAQIERKDAALHHALLALEYHTAQTRPIHVTIEAIKQVREALK